MAQRFTQICFYSPFLPPIYMHYDPLDDFLSFRLILRSHLAVFTCSVEERTIRSIEWISLSRPQNLPFPFNPPPSIWVVLLRIPPFRFLFLPPPPTFPRAIPGFDLHGTFSSFSLLSGPIFSLADTSACPTGGLNFGSSFEIICFFPHLFSSFNWSWGL